MTAVASLVTLLVAASSRADVTTPGLVAAYAFEDGASTSVADSSGRGNVGSLSGPTPTSSGRFRGALAFDGSNDRVNVPDAGSLDVTSGVTIEAWVYPTAAGTRWRAVAAKDRSSSGVVYGLYANRNTGVPAARVYAGGAVRTVDGAAPLPLNAWSHVAATSDGQTLTLYVDGEVAGTATAGGAISTSSGQLRIGGTSSSSEWFAGRIDEVRVYDRALTAAEIRVDMDAAIPSAPSVPALTLVESEPDQHASGRTLYYRPAVGGAGTFSVTAATADVDGGIAGVEFPAVFGTDGGVDASSPYEWTYGWSGTAGVSRTQAVTATNAAGVSSSASFTVSADTTAPAGGSVSYPDGYDSDGKFSISTKKGSDAGAGVNPSADLERQVSPLSGGACAAFGEWQAAPSSDTLASGSCGRYRYRVADNVGNEATYTSSRVVRVDRSGPAVALLAPTESTGAERQHFDAAAGTHYVSAVAGGSFSLGIDVVDAESGVGKPSFPSLAKVAGWTGAGGDSAAYSWTAGAAAPGSVTITGRNGAGLAASTAMTIAVDASAPTGGSVEYADGYDPDGVVQPGGSEGGDTGSGLDPASAHFVRETAALVAGSCGEFGAWSSAESPDAVASGRCARYGHRVADRVGNERVYTSAAVVKVDLTPPEIELAAPVELDGAGNQHYDAASRTLYVRAGAAGSLSLGADVVDPESGAGAVAYPDLGAFEGWSRSGESPSTFAWSPGATAPGRVTIAGTNGAGLRGSADLQIVDDAEPPAGGSVSYLDGYDADGTVLVALEPGLDSLSGLDGGSVRLERQVAALANGACGDFGSWEPAHAPDTLTTGLCARYRLLAADNVGNAATWSSTAVVRVDTSAPVVDLVPPEETEGEDAQHFDAAARVHWFRPDGSGSFLLGASTADPESGVVSVAWPDLSSFAGWSGDGGQPAYSWRAGAQAPGSIAIVARNGADLAAEAQMSLSADAEPPRDGSITYADGWDEDGIVTIGFDPGVDGQSGVDPRSGRLERQTASLAGDNCEAFGDWQPAESSDRLEPGRCGRYRYRVADRVGNEAVHAIEAVVRVAPPPSPDGPPPAAPALRLSESEPDAHVVGGTVYYSVLAHRGDGSGSFTVAADVEARVANVTFPELFGGDGGVDTAPPFETAYTWSAAAAAAGEYAVVAADAQGLTASSTFMLQRDDDGPAGGAIAYAGGWDADGIVEISASAGADAGAGVDDASAVLERQVAPLDPDGDCGQYGSPEPAGTTDVVPEGHCAKYAYRVWDYVGNRTSYRSSAEVKVDTAGPTAPGAPTVTHVDEVEATVAWPASTDNVGVRGYGVYRDGLRIANVAGTAYRFRWLGCDDDHAVAIDAVDAAGNRSDPVGLTVTTAPCPGPSEDADVFVAVDGSDAAPCSRLEPCATLARAYEVAAPGDLVEIGGGLYAEQVLEGPEKASPEPVVFQPAPGAAVVVGGVDIRASRVVLRRISASYSLSPGGEPVQGAFAIERGADGVTLEDVDGGHVFIGGDEARVLGGDFGPTVDQVSRIANESADAGSPPRDVVIDGALFHDYLREERHMECLHVHSADGLDIRNSTFDNCAVFAIFLKEFGPTDSMRRITIENNYFSNTLDLEMSAMVKLTTNASLVVCSDVLIRHNTFMHKLVVSDCPAENVRWESNLFESLPSGICAERGAGTLFDYNVIESGAACGANDVVVGDALLVDRAGGDFHLRPDSPARDRGSPTSWPARDFDGDARPQGAAPDAGADEIVLTAE